MLRPTTLILFTLIVTVLHFPSKLGGVALAKKLKYSQEEARRLRAQADEFQQAGKMLQAARAYKKALRLKLEFTDRLDKHFFYNNLGWTHHNIDQKAALKYYKKAIKAVKKPPMPHVYLNMGDLYRKQHNHKLAIKAFERAVKIKPSASSYATLGQLKTYVDRQDDAVEDLYASIELQPDFHEPYNYLGQTHSFQRRWAAASKAFVGTIQHGLPKNASGCEGGAWTAVESWEDSEGVTVEILDLPKVPKKYRKAFTEPITGIEFDDQNRKAKLVHLQNIHLEGRKLTRVFSPPPACTFYLGEHGASAAPPWDWGIHDENQPPLNPLPPVKTLATPLVCLFDRRAGHGNFYHHQIELVSRVLYFFHTVFAQDPDRWEKAAYLLPPGAMLNLDHIAADAGLDLPSASQFIRWNENDRFFAPDLYILDWTTGVSAARQMQHQFGTFNIYEQPLWALHFPPRSVMVLQRTLMRRSHSVVPRGSRPKIVYYSRWDTEKRHIEGEDAIIDALEDEFGRDSVEVYSGGVTVDLKGALEVFGDAHVVIGPHGAGLSNIIFCPPRSTLILIPSCDTVGCPAMADGYFGHLATALGHTFNVAQHAPRADFFRNYSLSESPDLVDELLDLTTDALIKYKLIDPPSEVEASSEL